MTICLLLNVLNLRITIVEYHIVIKKMTESLAQDIKTIYSNRKHFGFKTSQCTVSVESISILIHSDKENVDLILGYATTSKKGALASPPHVGLEFMKYLKEKSGVDLKDNDQPLILLPHTSIFVFQLPNFMLLQYGCVKQSSIRQRIKYLS